MIKYLKLSLIVTGLAIKHLFMLGQAGFMTRPDWPKLDCLRQKACHFGIYAIVSVIIALNGHSSKHFSSPMLKAPDDSSVMRAYVNFVCFLHIGLT